MKKLIPALVLLLVSAVLLSTSSYAWFSMNKMVSATGMSITAQVPSSLLISLTGNEDDFFSSVVLGSLDGDDSVVKTDIFPATYSSTLVDNKLQFYRLSDEGKLLVKNHDGKLYDFVDGIPNDEPIDVDHDYNFAGSPYFEKADDYVTDIVYIKASGSDETEIDLMARIKFTALNREGEAYGDSNIYKSLHVAFVIGDTVTNIDLSDADKNDTNNYFDSETAKGVVTTEEALVKNFSTAYDGDGVVEIAIYAWYDGIDEDSINANAVKLAQLGIDLEFFAAE